MATSRRGQGCRRRRSGRRQWGLGGWLLLIAASPPCPRPRAGHAMLSHRVPGPARPCTCSPTVGRLLPHLLLPAHQRPYPGRVAQVDEMSPHRDSDWARGSASLHWVAIGCTLGRGNAERQSRRGRQNSRSCRRCPWLLWRTAPHRLAAAIYRRGRRCLRAGALPRGSPGQFVCRPASW
jgi:hypothetical protein